MRHCLPLLGAAALVATSACKKEAPSSSAKPATSTEAAAPSASTAASSAPTTPFAVGIPVSPASVAKVVNPNGEEPYKGPTATLRGTVRIKGDPPPNTSFTFPSGKCGEAAATYGKLFRVGLEGAAADVLVTVTGYKGFVPARDEAEKVTIHGCAFARRTVSMTFGQRIEVANLDQIESYMPYLDGAPRRAVMIAVPRGAPVKLYPLENRAHYMIRDELPNPFLTADVFVLNYATHDVTGLDGQYEIQGIPVGKVAVNAFLPAIDKVAEQSLELKEGTNTLDLELTYGTKSDDAKDAGADAAPHPLAPSPQVERGKK
ncbi:MAG: hypothetical protein IPM54_29255 [Polyangiaceae bacterium]|nr:hypothetical protein [Polyangiaceae bacterium]